MTRVRKRTDNVPGFTLLELLIVMGLITLLISLVAVAVHSMSGAAGRTSALNALRQIQAGYASYTVESNGVLMPGFLDSSGLNQLGIKATLPSGLQLDQICNGGICDGSSYVWRLAPYLSEDWSTFYEGYRSEELISRLVVEYNDAQTGVFGLGSVGLGDIGIGAAPAFGLNSVFFGGDNYHGDDVMVANNPFVNPSGTLAATRLSEVRNAGRAIVFGSTRLAPGTTLPGEPQMSNIQLGYVELRPPYALMQNDLWTGLQWHFDETNTIVTDGSYWSKGGGVPVGRIDDSVPVSYIDGSTELLNIYTLGPTDFTLNEPQAIQEAAAVEIMRHWSPFSTGIQ